MRILTMLLLLGAGVSFADTVTLRDGRSIQGSFLGGDARTVRIAVGDRVETYAVGDIANLSFEAPPPPVAAQPPEPPPRVFRPEPREERREARAEQMIPAGTVLTIRMVDSVDSERDRLGQTFRASLDEPVIDNAGNTQVQRGADVVVKLVDDQQSGKIAGRTILTLDLVSLYINGRTVEIDTTSVSQQSSSRGERSAKVIGGTAALGAIIGAIAGGGKGAAIGAGAGAGAGTVAEVATKGQRVRIPSETRLTFTLQQPVQF
jgi:outer membrane lipoprotein SlyB